jgi:hypothetical protein
MTDLLAEWRIPDRPGCNTAAVVIGVVSMQKKEKKTGVLALHRETLRLLGGSELRGVVGGGRVHIPIGYADDTTPIYSWVDDTNP